MFLKKILTNNFFFISLVEAEYIYEREDLAKYFDKIGGF